MHILLINNKGIAAKSLRLKTLTIISLLILIISVYFVIKATLWFQHAPIAQRYVHSYIQTYFPSTSIFSNDTQNSNATIAQTQTIPLTSKEIAEQADIRHILKQDRRAIQILKTNLDSQLDLLNLHLAQMQAQLIQLDSLSESLIAKNNIDLSSLSLSKTKSIGGPVESHQSANKALIQKVLPRFSALAKEIENKSAQLHVFEAIYNGQYINQQLHPTGKPTNKGWISSYFGKRKDPFTGKPAIHKGIDIASDKGDLIVATAKGVVVWAGKRYGYGQLIEIDHGNDLLTRYGHCKDIDVTLGQIVEQGQVIGEIGSTGRSTGPHVHYEVIRKGVKLNPIKYVRHRRKQDFHL